MSVPERIGDFAKLWVGQTISQLGSQIGASAIGFTAILVLHATPLQLGLLGAARAGPVLLFGALAGAGVDRWRRRDVLIAADLGRALILLVVPACALLGLLRMEVLYVVAAAVAALAVFFDVAYPAYVPALIPPGRLLRANSRLSASESIAEIIGPGLGGALVQALTAPVAAVFDALSFLASAYSLGLIRTREPVRTGAVVPLEDKRNAGAIVHEAVLGMRFSITQPILRALLGQVALESFAGGIIGTLYGVYAVRELSLTPALMGIVVGVGGVSALIGAFLAERMVARFGLGRTLIGTGVLGWASAGLIVLAHGPLSVALPFLFASQAGDVMGAIFHINALSLRQASVPDHVMGRASSALRMVEGMLLPAGALVGGLLAEHTSVRATLAVGILIGSASLVPIVFSSIRGMRTLPLRAGSGA